MPNYLDPMPKCSQGGVERRPEARRDRYSLIPPPNYLSKCLYRLMVFPVKTIKLFTAVKVL
jgi:hypothetical protein